MTNGLSASDLVRGIISDSAQTLYALRVLRAHGMCDAALQAIYKSVVVAKLLYASSAWAGFITAADRQRVDVFFRRSTRCGFCPSDIRSFEELLKTSDEQLFGKIIRNRHHLLCKHPPPLSSASQNYDLRPRIHNARPFPSSHRL